MNSSSGFPWSKKVMSMSSFLADMWWVEFGRVEEKGKNKGLEEGRERMVVGLRREI